MTLIIFDVDGTLVYSNKLDSQCFADTYQRIYGLSFPSIDWSTYPHVTDDTIFKTVIQNHFQRVPSLQEIDTFKAAFVQAIVERRRQTPRDFKMVPGAKTTIEQLLRNDEYSVGIATGGWKEPAITKLNYVQIPTTPLIISGADGKETREQIIEEVLSSAKAQQIPFERIVYIGDAIWDVKTTRNMQLPLVGIRRNGTKEVLEQAGVQHVLVDYQDYDLFLKYVREAVPPA